MIDDPAAGIKALLATWDRADAERRAKEPKQPDDPIAPGGKIWQCCACGKMTRNRYGEEGGWDESCMLNAILVDDKRSPPHHGESK